MQNIGTCSNAQIKDWIERDFDAMISDAQAERIRKAAQKTILVWTPERLQTTDGLVITRNGVIAE